MVLLFYFLLTLKKQRKLTKLVQKTIPGTYTTDCSSSETVKDMKENTKKDRPISKCCLCSVLLL